MLEKKQKNSVINEILEIDCKFIREENIYDLFIQEAI
jgi:hypothetical protein